MFYPEPEIRSAFCRFRSLLLHALHLFLVQNPSGHVPDVQIRETRRRDRHHPRRWPLPYCLRHTYGTDLQDAGVPINVAKYLMGHSDITTTANIYTDTTDDSIESAREKINNKLCMSNCMSLEKEA